MLAFSAQPASAQILNFSIGSTAGRPGDTVNGQVNPADVAANCTTTAEGLQATFNDLFVGPFVTGNTEGALPQRFFPNPTSIVYQSHDQLSYALTLLVVLSIAQDINGAAASTLPETFVMSFADVATQQLIGPAGTFDPVTGVGSTTVPDQPPGLYAVVAACLRPTFDLDAIEAAVRQGGQFLQSIGAVFGAMNGPTSPEFLAFAQQYLNSTQVGFELLIEFVEAVRLNLLQPLMVRAASGTQLYTILPSGSIDIQRANVWRARGKPGRIVVKGRLQTGQSGPDDAIAPTDFAIRVTDGLDLDVTVGVAGSSCTLKKNGTVLCQDAAKTYRVRFTPVKKTPGLYELDVELTGLDISVPQAGPVTLTLDNGIPRTGTVATCRVGKLRIACRG